MVLGRLFSASCLPGFNESTCFFGEGGMDAALWQGISSRKFAEPRLKCTKQALILCCWWNFLKLCICRVKETADYTIFWPHSAFVHAPMLTLTCTFAGNNPTGQQLLLHATSQTALSWRTQSASLPWACQPYLDVKSVWTASVTDAGL